MDGFRIDRENTKQNAIQQDGKKVRRKSKYIFYIQRDGKINPDIAEKLAAICNWTNISLNNTVSFVLH